MRSDPSIDDLLSEVRRLEHDGELFRAYDVCLQGLERFPGDPLLAHRAVLNLCNAGAVPQARRKFVEYGLVAVQSIETLALEGRLLKSEAFRLDGQDRASLLRAAAGCYARAHALAISCAHPDAYFPGINLATLQLLLGETAQAHRAARDVLDQIEPLFAAGELARRHDAYWLLATAMEAWLVLGDLPRAHALVAPALLANDRRHSDLASSVRQLRRVLAAQGLPESALGGFAPPAVAHYTGHMMARGVQDHRIQPEDEPVLAAAIEQAIDDHGIGSAYGALAAGADLLFAEALLRRGAGLNVVLPFAVEDFIERSVRPFGVDWIPRFQHCLAGANTLRIATEGTHPGDDALMAYASQLAMGLAVLGGRNLCAPVRQLVVWDGQPERGDAGTAVDVARWARTGLPQTIIPCGASARPAPRPVAAPPMYAAPPARGPRAIRAMLFGDIKGFSKLGDDQLPAFVDCVLGAIGEVLDRAGQRMAFANSWGDAFFAVFDDARTAAGCALDMQDAISRIDFAAAGLPEAMALRIGGHLGPVHRVEDPILHRSAYMGAHVVRAARIEPITPEGSVYVTESFAALLALEDEAAFACEYVGVTKAAKQYGEMRMFLLHRRKKGPESSSQENGVRFT
ncbi:MAG: adenylate/guanylate cyclase domain-containing protein [Pseudomonadota bacterium]